MGESGNNKNKQIVMLAALGVVALAVLLIIFMIAGKGSDKKDDARDYVLSGFWGEELEKWQTSIDEASRACREYMTDKFQVIMNKHNIRNKK